MTDRRAPWYREHMSKYSYDCAAPAAAARRARRGRADARRSEALAELFKAFGDVTRVRLLEALHAGERCVCALAESLDMTPSAISHQLRLLRLLRRIRARKAGRSVFYRLDDDHIHSIFALALEHVREHRQ